MLKNLAICFLSFVFCLLVVVSAEAKEVFVGENDLAVALKKEFAAQGLVEDIELEVFGGQTKFTFEADGEVKIWVSNLQYDELHNKFSADVEVFADGHSQGKTTIMGKYFVMSEVWVPGENIAKGEIITDNKLKTIAVRTTRMKQIYITEKEKLMGREAKKSLKEGKPVTSRDIGDVLLIKKGDIVTSVYKTPHMVITAKVEAKEDGAEGNKIEVINTKSKKVFYGTVVSKDTVEVTAE